MSLHYLNILSAQKFMSVRIISKGKKICSAHSLAQIV